MKDIFKQFVLDLLFPSFCLTCAEEGAFICNTCYARITINNGDKALETLPESNLDGLISVSEYSEKSILPKLIHHYKYDYIKELYIPLGRLMADCLKEIKDRNFLLCSVPLHKKRLKWRGYNQSELLCLEIARLLEMKSFNPLKRIHFKKPQMELKRDERIVNTKDAFVIDQSCISLKSIDKEIPILLVDDVATTLSTLSECAKTLKNYGFKSVYGIVLARVH